MKKKLTDKEREKLLKKHIKGWMKENKGMMDEYYEICHALQMFKVKWGFDIDLKATTNPNKGRDCGVLPNTKNKARRSFKGASVITPIISPC